MPDQPLWMTLAVAAVYLAVLGVHLAFIRMDNHAPSWDQSHYLHMTYRYDSAMLSGGIPSFIYQLRSFDPGRAPLFSVAMMPFTAVAGSSFRSGELFNLALWPILLYSVYAIAAELFDRRTGTLAMVLTATMPLLVGLSHEVLQDFLVVTLTTVTALLILRTKSFERRWASIALGLVLGLDALAKVTAAVYVVAPLIVCLVWTGWPLVRELRLAESRRRGIKRLVSVAAALGIGTGIALLWYVPNLSPTLDYLRLSTSGQGVAGNAPPDYMSLRAFLAFTLTVANFSLGWLIVLAGLAALLIVVPVRLRALFDGQRPDLSRELHRALFLGSWIAVPLLLIGLSNNQVARYMASALPGIGVVVAGLLMAIGPAWLRRATIGGVCVLCVYQGAFIVLALPRVPGAATKITWPTPVGGAVLDFSGAGFGYDRPPDPRDYPLPIIEYLEARSSANGHGAPRSIGLLETRPYVNGNTLGYLADVRGDPFTFGDIFAQPPEELRASLLRYDFVLYIPAGAPSNYHLLVVNSAFAAGEVTPQMLAVFTNRTTLPAAADEQVEVLDRLP
jgi:4-amino-4-deoxy-L-arabinose transferase-like glycosyltransferase